jgi:hypothetical protein
MINPSPERGDAGTSADKRSIFANLLSEALHVEPSPEFRVKRTGIGENASVTFASDLSPILA